jgi:Arc/MetJ-type ribon-helix-helix transcriptional regulator
MATVNISLPDKLKQQADSLVKKGYYASLSDLIRHSLRKVITDAHQYQLWVEETKKDLKQKQAVIIKSPKDTDTYIDSL